MMKKRKYIRVEKLYSVNEIIGIVSSCHSFNHECIGFKWLGHIESLPRIINIDGYDVKISSNRLQTFVCKGTVCACCGIVGSYFAIEHHKHDPAKSFNLALYAELDGKEVLMTSDHIIPVNLGGRGSMFNRQTLCRDCNTIKSNKLISNEELFKIVQAVKRKRLRKDGKQKKSQTKR